MMISFVIISIGMFLMGPSSLLGLPNVLWIFLIGQGLVEGAQGFLFIPIIPELMESFYDSYGLKEGESQQVDEDICDRASGLYNTFYYSGMIVSPVLGSLVYEHYGNFNQTCDVFAIISVIYTSIFFLINVLPDWKTDLWKH